MEWTKQAVHEAVEKQRAFKIMEKIRKKDYLLLCKESLLLVPLKKQQSQKM